MGGSLFTPIHLPPPEKRRRDAAAPPPRRRHLLRRHLLSRAEGAPRAPPAVLRPRRLDRGRQAVRHSWRRSGRQAVRHKQECYSTSASRPQGGVLLRTRAAPSERASERASGSLCVAAAHTVRRSGWHSRAALQAAWSRRSEPWSRRSELEAGRSSRSFLPGAGGGRGWTGGLGVQVEVCRTVRSTCWAHRAGRRTAA